MAPFLKFRYFIIALLNGQNFIAKIPPLGFAS